MSSYDFAPRSGGLGLGKIAASVGAGAAKIATGADAAAAKVATKAATSVGGAAKAAPVRVVQVRAHTRTVPVRTPTPSPTPAAAAPVLQAKTLAPVTIPSVSPVDRSTVKRFVPNFPKEPVAGQVGAFKNPDGTWVNPGTKPQPGAYIAERPYYTNASTLTRRAGPPGQESTQLNAAQVAQAKKIQVANYGKPGYIARSLVPGGLDEGGTTSVTKAIVRGAEAASTVLPGGGTEVAGLFGLGLKGLKVVRTGKDVAEVAPKVAETAAAAPKAVAEAAPAAAKATVAKAPAGRSKEQILADPKSWTERNGGRFLTADAAKELDAVTRVNVEGNLSQTPVARATRATARPTTPTARPSTPKVAPPSTAHTTEEAAAVRGALKGAPNVRAGQAGDFSAQRRGRFGKADSIMLDTSIPVEERQARAFGALKGSLDRPVFTGFKKMTPETVTNIKAQIMEHPTLRTGQKLKLLRSLDRGVAGIVPTAGEHKLFTQVFGKETALGLAKAAKTGRWKNIVANVINVPRTLQSTLDMSSFLRQGAVALARHPVITGGNFKTLVRSFASEGAALKVESDIASHPNYPLMRAAKLALTGSGDLQPQEEQFGANMLENLGGNKNPVRWSSRSYSAFLNKTRADIFNHLLDVAHSQGHNIHDEKFLGDLGNMVNVFTGRGKLPGDWERAAKVFNGLFFSPRLMSSRLHMIGQPFNPTLNPFVRRQYQRAAAQGFGALLTVLGLAKTSGLDVGVDPTSADFGKIKFGNTRVDLGAGFLQYAHLAGQLVTGKSTSSTTGKVSHIYSGKAFQRSAHDVLSGFFEGKLSPPFAFANDVFKHQTNFGKFNIWQELINHLTPLSSQDIYGVATNRSKGPLGAAEVAAAGAFSVLGGGLQTYGPKAPKTRGGGGGGGSSYDFTPAGSGGGSSYDFTPAP